MQTQIKIEQCEKPYCVIHTSLETDSIKEIAQKISMMDESGKPVGNNIEGEADGQGNPVRVLRIPAAQAAHWAWRPGGSGVSVSSAKRRRSASP